MEMLAGDEMRFHMGHDEIRMEEDGDGNSSTGSESLRERSWSESSESSDDEYNTFYEGGAGIGDVGLRLGLDGSTASRRLRTWSIGSSSTSRMLRRKERRRRRKERRRKRI